MDESFTPPATSSAPDLSVLLIGLLKRVQYREDDEPLWSALLRLQARIRDYVAVLNLELILDEAEGYAFLKSRAEPGEDDPSPRLPRLIARRPLTYAVSLLLALLRKKLAEFDAGGSDTRLVLSRDDIVELVRVFLPDGPNEARLIDQMEATINKVVDLGFLHRLKPSTGTSAPTNYEVRRILKAFVDAQWLAEFDARLSNYQNQLANSGVRT
ncbi:DUF4194 domain-containing protein [Tahibacter amnicola]|uniref:DUF4194 domain-containing protein n=1 Tax=Tahibacter amnicola TaxID=2976241 RepID=A0ABY6BIU9_9GAMM|nr:DUF4194 domain-containing protein [Tahibacter amnicola]UXI69794.1 DUF4194 domain-containing protein [Tahibacter amnicola]